MKIVYMGTPDIAVPAFEKIIEAKHEVVAAVTQPDRARGRHKELVACPVKEVAIKHGIQILQPESAKDPDFIQKIKNLNPDVIVVMAYGQILKKELLEIPKFGSINIHASLLPKYRGAAPISAAILYGDDETGVTTMYMDEGLDTGDMILQKKIKIDAKETLDSLEAKIASLGGDAIIETLNDIENNTATRTKQDDSQASYIKMIKKEEGKLDFSDAAINLERKIRAYNPWPGTFTSFEEKRIKIFEADVIADSSEEPNEPGTILSANDNGITVQTGDGLLNIISLQAEGKKRMQAGDFLRGFKLNKGDKLSS